MINLIRVSAAFIRIQTDYSIQMEIKDHFTFKAPNYQFHPAYKARLWDGNISLVKNGLLPAGLYHRLIAFAKENQYEITSDDDFSDTDIELSQIKDFVASLQISDSKGRPIQVRDYQIDGVYQAIKSKTRTLVSPTSSGKSLIIYCIMRYLLEYEPDVKIALIVPNVQLVNQMFSDFEEYSLINNFQVTEYLQKLYSGKSRELNAHMLVTTWHSLKSVVASQSNEVMRKFGCVIVDECHTAKAMELQKLLEKSTNAFYRIGTTGTMDSEKINQLVIEGFLGPSYQVITTRTLMDNKQVTNLIINPIILSYPIEECKLVKDYDYAQEIDYLVSHPKRLDICAKLVASAKGTSLFLVTRRDSHAVPLVEAIKKYATKPVYYVSGTVSPEERERIRLIANIEDCIIVATYKTMATGTNIPNIRNVFFGSPHKSMIQVIQSIGRGLRLAEGKTIMKLYDLIDDLRYKKKDNYSYTHSTVRFAIYQKEQFEIGQPKEIKLV